MDRLLPKILGWLVVIVSLALAPSINTANTAAQTLWGACTNNASMIGMSIMFSFGAPLMIISLLFAGTMLGLGKVGDGTIKGMLDVIGSVIITIVAITMFSNVITYVNTLMTGSTGFALTIYGIIPIVLYIAVIAGAGGYTAYKALKGKGKGKKSKAFAY